MSDFNQWFNSGSPPVDDQTNTHAEEPVVLSRVGCCFCPAKDKRIAELEAFKQVYDMAILDLDHQITWREEAMSALRERAEQAEAALERGRPA